MLVHEVAREFGDNVKVAVEDYGHSDMAQRFGVRRYPVVFVDDVLLARPKDFGFGGPEDVSGGLYVPWLDPGNQQRFKEDLRRAVTRRLAGQAVAGLNIADVTQAPTESDGPSTYPAITLRDLSGREIAPGTLAGRMVLVEMWATWCPPCRSTLAWLSTLQQQNADRLTVIAIAVDSQDEDVRKIVREIDPAYRVAMATKETVGAFGAVAAVPKLLLFDASGRRTHVLYGAPPDLHDQIRRLVGAR